MLQAGVKGVSERSELTPCIIIIYYIHSYVSCTMLHGRNTVMYSYSTSTVASSPGHSQFLMIHAKNEMAWFAKSRAPHLGGRVVIVRGTVTCLRVVLAVPIVPGTGIVTDRRVAIAALQ